VKGFGARITAAGARSFVLRYVFDSREYRYTIGPFPSLSVEAARREAKRLRATIDLGQTHPMAEREKKRSEARARREAETFAEAVDDYIIREQIGRRKNATANQVKRGLTTDCAAWKNRPVADIKAADIRKLLETIRDGDKDTQPRPYLANRTYAYLKTFFAWCAEPGIEKIPLSPMIGLRRPWEGEEARQRWFTDDELKALWAVRRRTRRGRWRLPQDGHAHGQAPERAGLHAVGPHRRRGRVVAAVGRAAQEAQQAPARRPSTAACASGAGGHQAARGRLRLRLPRQSQGNDASPPVLSSSAASARLPGSRTSSCMPAATRWRRAWPSCASRRTSAT
jgi:hypothetical protein